MNEETVASAEELITNSVPKRLSVGWSWQLVKESCGLRPSHKSSVQLVRSLVVSVIALAADFGSLVALKELAGIHYLVAASMSFFMGLVVNYALSAWWVFAGQKMSDRRKEFVVFSIILGVGALLNLGIIAGLVQIFGVDYRIAKAASTALVFFWNFFARKKLLY